MEKEEDGEVRRGREKRRKKKKGTAEFVCLQDHEKIRLIFREADVDFFFSFFPYV